MLRPVIREEYYVPSPGLNNLLGMLKSPMVLMMIFSGVMMFGLPKLTVSSRMRMIPLPWRGGSRCSTCSTSACLPPPPPPPPLVDVVRQLDLCLS